MMIYALIIAILGLVKGTTIVGICCRDGVILGADSRATGGEIVMDKNKVKIHQISPQLFCCAAGTAADCEQAARSMKMLIATSRIENALGGENGNLASSYLVKSKIIQMFNGGSGSRPIESSIILGGHDNDGHSLHQISKTGVMQVSCCASGSGQIDALSTLESRRKIWGSPIENEDTEDYLRERRTLCENVLVDDAVQVVREAVRSGVMNDLGSGSYVDICIIQGPKDVQFWRENAENGRRVALHGTTDEIDAAGGHSKKLGSQAAPKLPIRISEI